MSDPAPDPAGPSAPGTVTLLDAIGWFIPNRDVDRVALLRSQLYVVLSVLIAVNTGAFAVLHGLHHVPGTSKAAIWVLIGMCVVSLTLPFLLKLRLPMGVLNALFIVVLQGGVATVACVDGGLRSGAMFWLVVAPLAAAFLGGARLGQTSTAISAVSGLAIYGAARLGHTFPASLSASDSLLHYAINFVAGVGFIAAIAALYEGPMVHHFQDLSQRLRDSNADLRRELTERQRAQAQAEAASRAKDTLLANMSHEFRTPLTAILGNTELLVDEASPDDLPLLQSIDRGGRRLLNTLNGVLDLVWLESGETGVEFRPVDALALVSETTSGYLPTAVQRGLSFEVSGVAAVVLADAKALRRIVAAVVDNAVRFTESGSVEVTVLADDDRAEIRVVDTGIGMDPEFLVCAAQPFRQASEGDARTHEGVGVGLTIADRLLKLMGGTLSIESVPGHGTAVSLYVPLLPRGRTLIQPLTPRHHGMAADA